jgi:hypothetical protein
MCEYSTAICRDKVKANVFEYASVSSFKAADQIVFDVSDFGDVFVLADRQALITHFGKQATEDFCCAYSSI